MIRIKHVVSFIAVVVLLIYFFGPAGQFREGVIAPNDPYQVPVPNPHTFSLNGSKLTAVAQYTSSALVLSRLRYFWGRGAKLSPLDLALGWGPMSDGKILKHFRINQFGRFFFWWTSHYPIPRNEIESHSANVHMIPANKTIALELKKVRKGDLIRFKGYLVNVEDINGWKWQTSLSRHDTGPGACEIVWIEELLILDY